ncbi:MAG: ATP-binding cassette domain-containing protein [Spirochaetaceae bacterium]|nr:ATP-binding cassette domain-containing protein [Spirochaetaceae bacterium]
MRLIRVRSLSYTYPGAEVPALSDVSLELAEGEYLAIVGANGSGKSTLVRCLNGLIAPPAGAVSVAGADPSEPAGRAVARRALSIVFQSPPDQIVASVVEEDVAFGLENLGVPRPEMRDRVAAALRDVGLESERSRSPRFLSAGQQQRLAVAGAIAMRPRAVAFDEATSMIDPVGREDVLRLMDGLVAAGIAVIHVTHDMDEAARAARVLALSEGRVVYDGTPAGLFASGEASRYRLGLPRSYQAAIEFGLEPVIGEGAAGLGRRIAEAGAGTGAGTGASEAARPVATAGASRGSAFSLRGATMRYLAGTESERLAVDSATLELPSGAITALIGRTGSGKSSLLQLLDALALPDSGVVVSLGSPTAEPGTDLRAVRMRAPLAVQRPETAMFELYAGDEVAFGPRNQGLSGKALVERCRAAMDEAGLPYAEYRDRLSRTLSGGRKRRLAIASVLALDPEALLLDEPTSALDPASRGEVMRLIRSYADSGRTVVMSTHSMDEAALADMVAVMRDGAVAAFGPPGLVFGDGWDPSWGVERPFAYELREASR